MDVQSAANLNIPEGSVRNIHDKDKRLLWSAVGYNVRYDGDTTQQTYSGKNMLNVPDGSQTTNGITWTRESGVCHGVGTLTGQTYSNIVGHIDLNLPAGYYTFSIGEALPSPLQIEFSTRDNNETRRNYRISAGATSSTYNFPNGLKWTGISLVNGTIGQSVDVTIKNVQIETGSTATSYEPYVGGIPAPNPDYPQDVNVVKGAQSVLISAKNLLSVSFAVAGSVPSDVPTNTFVLDRENQRFFRCDFPTLLPSGTYTISFDISNNNTVSGVSFNIFNKSQATIGGAYNLSGSHYSGTFTVTESIQIIRWFIASNESNDKHATISNVQIEAGFTATAYEMYQGQQTFPVDLIGKNLFSGWTIGKKLNGSGVETTDQNGAVSDYIPVASNTNYIFSDIPDGLYTFIAAYNSQKQFLGRTGASGGSSSKGCKTLPSYFSYGTPAGTGDVAYLRVTAYQSGQYADPITVINSLQTQLEVGTSATPYVPYYNYELCKIGDYQDYIYKNGNDWYVYKETGKVAFSGGASENWDLYIAGEVFRIRVLDMMGQDNQGITAPLYCKYYTPRAYSVITSPGRPDYGIAGRATAANGIAIRNKDCADVTAFKTWLGTHNTTVHYILATPTYTKITDNTLISQLNAVHDWLRRYDYYGVVSGNLPIIINRSGII